MRCRSLFIGVVVLLLFSANVRAACTTPQCLAATAWHKGYTLFILGPDAAEKDWFPARQAIMAEGGSIALITQYAMTGWIDPARA